MDSDSRSGDEAEKSPLLEGKAANGWLNKLIDVAEAKEQVMFALPMILTNAAYYFILLVSVMFAGHLGELPLAASNLANSWAAVTGFSLMVTLHSISPICCVFFFNSSFYTPTSIFELITHVSSSTTLPLNIPSSFMIRWRCTFIRHMELKTTSSEAYTWAALQIRNVNDLNTFHLKLSFDLAGLLNDWISNELF